MKRYIISILLLLNSFIVAQSGYIDVEHKIYPFLERMNTLGFIDNYNGFEIPKTNTQIKQYLIEIINNKEKLSDVDHEILNDLVFEFDYLFNGTDLSYSSILNNKFAEDYYQSNKSIYSYVDSSKNGFFINFAAYNSTIIKKEKMASIFTFGGEVKGYLFNELGFYLKGTNGTYKGDKNTALNYGSLKYNYKANLNPNYEGANSFFDETEGYLFFEKRNYNFKLGRDRIILGQGIYKPFLGNNAPPIDYFKFNINYSIFNFSYLHGKLLSSPNVYADSLWGEIHSLQDKYLVYHRFEINFSKHFKLGLGEFIIYGNRSVDLSYLNPFNFYKSIEHINQDRDNSSLFIDISNNTLSGFSLYLTLFIDDIDFSKLGKKWYGNQTLWDIGINITPKINNFSGGLAVQYLRIEPFVFTHRIPYNNFTSLNYLINDNIEPNSQLFNVKFYYYFTPRVSFLFQAGYKEHGSNLYDEKGTLVTNYGGSVKEGHRPFDSEQVKFLDGLLIKSFNVLFEGKYEFIRNNFISLYYYFENEKSPHTSTNESTLILNIKLKI